jgi:hypothetical protein
MLYGTIGKGPTIILLICVWRLVKVLSLIGVSALNAPRLTLIVTESDGLPLGPGSASTPVFDPLNSFRAALIV